MRSEVMLACPSCGASLEHRGTDWNCGKCGRVGTDVDGVPCFNDPNYYWGEIPKEAMQQANAIARERNWQDAVQEVVADPEVRSYITDPRRADFQYVWDLPKNSRILDIGAGWGAIASALGKNFDSVTAVEGVIERARFIDVRVRQLGLSSVTPICADFLRLPLAPGQFDAVVLNGVLEWIGLASMDGNPRDLQLRFLKRVHELLKPNGFVCVGIENRVGWGMFRGGPDHSGMPYTSLMPRAMAAAWCSWKNRNYRSDWNKGYRAYTYSLPGYRKLFRQAGFRSVRPYHAWDGYNKPTVLLPLDDKAAVLHFIGRIAKQQQSPKGRIKNAAMRLSARTGLWRQMASEYVFIVGKD